MTQYAYDIRNGVPAMQDRPVIPYGSAPTVVLSLSGEIPPEWEGISLWTAAVATDWNSRTAPVCRTLEGISLQGRTLSIPLDARTQEFLDAVDGRESRTAWLSARGYGADGAKIADLRLPVVILMDLDPGDQETTPVAQAALEAVLAARDQAAAAKDQALQAKATAQEAAASAAQSSASASASADRAALSATDAADSKAESSASAQAASAAAGSASASSAEAVAAASSAAASENDAELASSAAGLHAEEAQAAVEECRNLSQVRPPACTDLGISRGQSQVEVTWGDPANLVQSGWVLCETQRTVLVAKSGGYPESPEDGTIVAATSRTPQTDAYPLPSGVSYQYLGYYRLTPITVQLPEADDVCLKLFSCSRNGAWNSLPANEYPSYTDYSWGQLAEYADAGTFLSHVPLGSAIQAGHADFPNMEWLVVGDDMFNRADLTTRKTVGLIMRYVPFTSQYDAPEDTWALTEDAAAVTGVKYGLNIDGTITAVTEHTDWEAGDTSITRDGVEYPISLWMERNPNTSQGSGTNLSSQSNLLQWANSDGPASSWFVKKNLWDKCASQLVGKNGFLRGLPQSFRDCLVDVRKTAYVHAAYRIRGRGASETYDAKVFPLSSYEIFGTAVGSVTEGKKKADLFAANADRIAYLEDGVTPQTWWSASAITNYAYGVYCVSAAGASANGSAYVASGVRLACALGKQDS